MFCKCGCGQQTNWIAKQKRQADYIVGHNNKGRKMPEIERRQLGKRTKKLWKKRKKTNKYKEICAKISQKLKGNENGKYNRIYSLSEDIFDNINSNNKAYWLGFLMADGYIQQGMLGLKLNKRDLSHLEKFKIFIKSEHPVSFDKSGKYAILQIVCKKLVKSLNNSGMVAKKSLILKFPFFLKKELYRHFIRGYFDGDGWISIIKRDGQMRFGIIGNINFINELQNILVTNCKIKKNKLRIDKRHNKAYASVNYGGNKQCKRIYEFLYKNAHTYLERKKLIWVKN